MSKTINVQDTYTSNTVSFDSTNSNYASVVSGYPIENGIGDGSGTYAGFVLANGSSAVTNIYYNFNCSGIFSGKVNLLLSTSFLMLIINTLSLFCGIP